MSWDQTTCRQGVRQFVIEELGIDVEALIEKAIQAKLAEMGLSYEISEDHSHTESGYGYSEGDFHPTIIKFSDGRVFVDVRTADDRGDDWGSDYYSFVEVGKPYELRREAYCGCEDDPHVTIDTMPPVSIDPVRIANFFAEHGIDKVSIEPGDDDDESAGC